MNCRLMPTELSVGLETFAGHLKTHLFRVGFSDYACTFEFVSHFIEYNTSIRIIIIVDGIVLPT